jgi:UDP-3-O-[3-hydroxymyristoyl] N-acetylglucosamine deacetylase/3-hydroxyacyl-[acyl-carrier-protein] dehydratase
VSERRRTIERACTLEGIGLHLGMPCRLTCRPGAGGEGIAFIRTDAARPGRRTPARVDAAVQSERRTQLGEGDVALHTVEHVLAAAAGLGIDDLVIEMDGPEPPILDGSAAPYAEALVAAGIVPGGGMAEYLGVAEPFVVRDGESEYRVSPANALELEVEIDFAHPLVGRQRGRWVVTPETFLRELAGARTFGFAHELEALRSRGLIKGGSTENAILLDAEGVVDNDLRWPDEFVRHKALDCIGDLALTGRRVRARISAHRPSHRGTVTLVRELLRRAAEERRVFEIEDIMRTLPHRYPFLLVDRILEYEAGRRVVGIKNVTINEPFFQGHCPGHPIMPGVLIIEAMAQVGGMLLLSHFEEQHVEDKVVYFMSLDNVKFRRPVLPGDQLRFELEMVAFRGKTCRMKGQGFVDGQVVAEAEMMAVVVDK